jgi:signal transduction histidine kinase/CheY-like chemotaxis protein
MTVEKDQEILLVAGDYDIVQHIQQALTGTRANIHNAFNHREALYVMVHGSFDAIIVDAAMKDRHGGDCTLEVLASESNGLPIISIALDDEFPERAYELSRAVINKMDHQDITFAISQALDMPIPQRTTREVNAVRSGDVTLQRQLDEISTLFDLSKSLTEVLDLNEVLNRVVEAARNLTNAEEVMILLPEGEEFYLRAKVGMELDTARNFRVKTQDTLAGQVFKTGKPILIGESGPQKVKTEYFVNSLLYVPILQAGRPIGVLGANNRNKTDPFDIHHQKLLVNLASFASIAIQNARIHLDSLERARELETLVTASKVVNSSLALDETLPNICKQIATVLDVGYSEIYEWKKTDNHLCTLARFYEAAWRFGHGPTIDLAQDSGVASALASNSHLVIRAQDHKYPTETGYLGKVGAEAMLILPVGSGERMMGALRAFFIAESDIKPDADTLKRIRHMALESLVNLLNRTDRIMSDNLRRLATEVNEAFGADWCDLSLVKQGKNSLTVLARIGNGVWLESAAPHIELDKFPDLQNTLDTQSTINQHARDQVIRSGPRHLLESTESRTVLGIPLVQRGNTAGLVILADTERDREQGFTEREIAMAQAIVGQAATALENANLVRDLESSFQELKNAQDRLVQAARLSAMGELAAVVAHQINNPLTTIIVDTELMLLDTPEDSPNHKSLTAISRAGKRAANVARRLLAIARPGDDSGAIDLIDVVDTIKGVLSLVQTHIERGNVRVFTKLPEEPLPPVAAAKGRLDDVWLNLIMNAYDALGEQDKGQIAVEVALTADSKSIEVTIADNGPGIPPEIRDEIFSPFFTTKPVGDGTGLGLHVCREVVENVGGRISVDSKLNKYTRFTVWLPVTNT